MGLYDINGKEIIQGVGMLTPLPENLWDWSKCTVGALTTDGSQNTSYTYYTSNFIKVESGKDYTIALADTSLPGQHIYCLYDENKAFLSTVRTLDDSTDLNGETGLVISISNSNAKYIRVSMKKEAYKHVKMSEGATIPDEYGITATIDFGKPVYNEGVVPYGVFAGSSLLVQGDSLCGGDSFSYNYTPKTWVDYIADWLKIGTLYNDSVSNTGLKMHSDATIGYVARQAKWLETYGADIDRIIIFGNMNDMQDACGLPVGEKTDASGADTVYGLLRKLIEAIVEDYPTAKIGFITSPCRGKSYALGACYGHGYYEGYVTAQKYICEEFGIPFLDLYHECATLRPYNADNKAHYFPNDTGGVHFNHEGHQAVAKQVLKWFVEKMS